MYMCHLSLLTGCTGAQDYFILLKWFVKTNNNVSLEEHHCHALAKIPAPHIGVIREATYVAKPRSRKAVLPRQVTTWEETPKCYSIRLCLVTRCIAVKIGWSVILDINLLLDLTESLHKVGMFEGIRLCSVPKTSRLEVLRLHAASFLLLWFYTYFNLSFCSVWVSDRWNVREHND